MSMISAQIDELRQMADGQATYRDARVVMLQAADTITELRGALLVASVDYRHLSEENAKLRELVAGIGHLLFTLDVDYCAACPRDGVDHPCPAYTVDGGECLYKTDMRELGIEVK